LGVPDGFIVRLASQHKSRLQVDACLSKLSFGFSRRERVKSVEYPWLSMRVLSLKEMEKGAFLPPISRCLPLSVIRACPKMNIGVKRLREAEVPPIRTLFCPIRAQKVG